MNLTNWQNKNIAILWYGAEGKSTHSFLLTHWIKEKQITILDKNLEENYLKNLHTYDVIFKSSGIPYFPEILEVSEKVITQVQFFFFHYTGNVIAITASKGKTTMTSLAYELLKNAGYNVKVVGNIGKPVLEEINFDETYDFVVIELSSYMLQTLKKQNTISILGSLFPDHLDRHRGMDSYIKAKLNILEGSETNIIFSSTLNMLASQADKASLVSTGHTILCGKMTPYDRNDDSFLLRGKPIFPLSDIQLLGEHNLRNMSAIVALADLLDIPTPILHETIKHFQPVRHRLQNVGTFKGITFYDDAISTTPDSTIAALDALGNKVETIFLGGLDRGYDFQPLVERIKKSQIKHIVFFPKSGQKIEQLLWEYPNGKTTLHTASMQAAVKFAYQYTSSGKICLLSTASPSYTVWKNFEEKGDLFQKYVVEYGKCGEKRNYQTPQKHL